MIHPNSIWDIIKNLDCVDQFKSNEKEFYPWKEYFIIAHSF